MVAGPAGRIGVHDGLDAVLEATAGFVLGSTVMMLLDNAFG